MRNEQASTLRAGTWALVTCGSWLLLSVGCGSEANSAADAAPDATTAPPERASDNFIMPEKFCPDDDPQQCFWNANGGCVAPGQVFAEHGECAVVRTQGIPWQRLVRPPAAEEPRLADPAFARELAWVTEQVEACACTCCHDSRTGSANIYDVNAGPSWVSAMTDRGLMMAAGIVNTDVLGAFEPGDNHGFDRYTTVFPTTDVARFQKFFRDELAHRGVPPSELEDVEPLGGPLTENSIDVTEPCAKDTGVDASGTVHWRGGPIRYAWIMEADAANPGIPPNLDLPNGTLWYASVHHEADALTTGQLAYSATPSGATQMYPAAGESPQQLTPQTNYKLFLLRDHGVYLLENCSFTYPIPTPAK